MNTIKTQLERFSRCGYECRAFTQFLNLLLLLRFVLTVLGAILCHMIVVNARIIYNSFDMRFRILNSTVFFCTFNSVAFNDSMLFVALLFILVNLIEIEGIQPLTMCFFCMNSVVFVSLLRLFILKLEYKCHEFCFQIGSSHKL